MFNLRKKLKSLKLKKTGKKFNIEVNTLIKKPVSSNVKIDIIIPAVEKDLIALPHVIDGARKHIKHPLGEIVIISPTSEKIKKICREKNARFIHEDSLLPITKKDIDYTADKKDRSGWLYQQILKWCGNKLSSMDHFLLLDSDTVFITPQIFKYRGKTIFNIGDEYYRGYFKPYEEIMGRKALCPMSFVCHYMLIEKNKLQELKKDIEKRHKKKWYTVIIEKTDKSDKSGYSEYETYGNFIFSNYREEIILEDSHNLHLKSKEIKNIEKIKEKYKDKYKSVSFHSYQ